MKNLKIIHLLFLLPFVSSLTYASESDSLNEIGDNLDLFSVLETFKNSNSIKIFEEKLNSKDEKLNNLDLNEDGIVDYIQVIDTKENSSHAIILKIDLDENESQDIAVIEIEQKSTESVSIQIVGDIDIYGNDYLIEPIIEDSKTESFLKVHTILYVNVWHWNSIRYLYAPSYVVWRSPYKWKHYPTNWKTWRPYNRYTYYNFHKHNHKHYHIVNHHQSTHSHALYQKHRTHCKAITQHPHHHSNHKAGHNTKTNKQVVKKNHTPHHANHNKTHPKAKSQQTKTNKTATKTKTSTKKNTSPKKGNSKRK